MLYVCEAQPVNQADSTAEKKDFCIVIDPGHGGVGEEKRLGAYTYVGDDIVYEKNLNLEIAGYLEEELEKYVGVTVYLTREDDKALELDERIEIAEGYDADLVVSIHNNASGGDDVYTNGSAVLTSRGQYKEEIGKEEQELGVCILDRLSELGLEDQGLFWRDSEAGECYENGELADYYGLIRGGVEADIPSIIVEHAFIDDKDDYDNYLSDSKKLKQLAKADAQGIADYYGFTDEKTETKASHKNNIEEKIVWLSSQQDSHVTISKKTFFKKKNEDKKTNSNKSQAGEVPEGRPLRIVLDAGHGGKDSGAERDDNGALEKTLNMKIANYLQKELESYKNVEVYLTRDSDEKVDLDDRIDYSVEKKADLMVSLHNNAAGDIADYDNGCNVLTSNCQYRSEIGQEEQELACNILYELSEIGLKDQGILTRLSQEGETYDNGELADYYRLVRGGVNEKIPTIIVEHAFIDNDSDYEQFLDSDDKLEALAKADARGIARYYKLEKKEGGEKLASLENVKEKQILVVDEDYHDNIVTYENYFVTEKSSTESSTAEESTDEKIKEKNDLNKSEASTEMLQEKEHKSSYGWRNILLTVILLLSAVNGVLIYRYLKKKKK